MQKNARRKNKNMSYQLVTLLASTLRLLNDLLGIVMIIAKGR